MTPDRYSTAAMRRLWSDADRLNTWAQVEIAAARAQGAPPMAMCELAELVKRPTVEDVDREEATTQHEVIAFVRAWRAKLSNEAGSWVHRNMTSSDLVDTAMGVRLDRSFWIIDGALDDLIRVMAKHAVDHRRTVRVGRTHGQHAELTTWGYRVAGFAHALHRARRRFVAARSGFAVGKLSGPVGDYKRVTPAVEREFVNALGLTRRAVTTQVVPRDGFADFVWSCAQIVAAVEDIATEVRLSSRSEVGELVESFKPGQMGSSAMPHKRNPITAERLCGIARLVRSRVALTLENAVMHHERDLAHSSAERVVLAEVATLTHFALTETVRMWRGLVVDADRMKHHARHAANVALSAAVKDALVESGVNAELAWQLVHEAAKNTTGNLVEEVRMLVKLEDDIDVTTIDWKPLFELSTQSLIGRTGNVDHVFEDLELWT